MKYDHQRINIVSSKQHILKHTISDMLYYNDVLPPSAVSLQDAMDWIFNVLYPKNRPSVDTVSDLPLTGNEPNDYRVVNDDGDGNPAGYLWASWDGDVTSEWHKVADFDWGINDIIQGVNDTTQPWYVSKWGNNDSDESGNEYTGELAGQRIFGGTEANTNLILFANNGDITGNTGFIQIGDDLKPLTDSIFSLGTTSFRFLNGYFNSIYSGTLQLTSGLITDSSGQISFDNENIITTGTIISGNHTIDTLLLSSGLITDTSGSISFGDNNVTTTGSITGSAITASSIFIDSDLSISSGSITSVSGAIDFGDSALSTTSSINSGDNNVLGSSTISTISISDNSIVSTNTVDHLEFTAGGLKAINVGSTMITKAINATGGVSVNGSFSCDNITLNGNEMTIHGDLQIQPTGWIVFRQNTRPFTDNLYDLGLASYRFKSLYLANSINDGTNSILTSELMGLRSANYRDTGRTSAVQVGDYLSWSGAEWLATPEPDISHTALTGLDLTDAGHTQFVMLDGRTGGQSINGGDATTETLSLFANIIDGEGVSILTTAISPIITDTYDIGSSTNKFDDIYMIGEMFGARAENDTLIGLSAKCGAGTKGRLFFCTDDNFLYTDIGGSPRKVGQNSYNSTLTETELLSSITVSSSVSDARNCIWQLSSISDSYEIIYADITKTETTVTVATATPLPSGNYKLLGIEV